MPQNLVSDKPRINKARIWNFICYLENMIDGWQDEISDLIPLPLVYCIHDKDKDVADGERKLHAHITVVWKNTTTYKHALSVINLLSKPGTVCCSTLQACLDIRRTYDYLIHDTENAKKKGKHLYGKEERIELNGFDIGLFEQLSADDKERMAEELCDFTVDGGFRNMRELYIAVKKNFDSSYFAIYRSNNALLSRLCKGNYQDEQLRYEDSKRPGIKDFERMK